MMCILIRHAVSDDLIGLLELYAQNQAHDTPVVSDSVCALWQHILNDSSQHILLGTVDNTIIATCTLVIVSNLTHNQRPYALIENVITHPEYRNNGYGSAILNRAREIAQDLNCYKIMLMTGSKREKTLQFYEQAGYNSADKTAFVQWLS